MEGRCRAERARQISCFFRMRTQSDGLVFHDKPVKAANGKIRFTEPSGALSRSFLDEVRAELGYCQAGPTIHSWKR